MRYLVVSDSRLVEHAIRAIRRYDRAASVCVMAVTREAAEAARAAGAGEVLEGEESLRRVDLKHVDAAVVWLDALGRSCEVAKELRRAGVPLLVAVSFSAEGFRHYRECGFDFLVPLASIVDGALGSIVGLDSWVEVPIGAFAGVSLRAYRVFRRARLGISLRELLGEVEGGCLVAVFDRDGNHVSSPDYKLSEGDLIVVVAPSEGEASRVVGKLSRLFALAERVYTALESRRPLG